MSTPERKEIKDVTKSWKTKFFEVKDIDRGTPPKTIIPRGKHGLLKDKKNAN